MKKILSIFLCVVLILGVLPSGVFSVGAATSGYYTYTVENGEATITECDISISGDITIPSTLGGYSVTSIGDDAFWGCYSLTSITIPDSVTSIGDFAFSYCESLTSITIPNSVTSIGGSAFSDCTSLTSITIPNSVTSIGNSAFSYCESLTSITIPDSVTSIGYSTFHRCYSLTSVTIPNSVTSIGDYAFSDCSSLTSITIPNSVKSIGDYAFFDCTSLTSITVSENNKNYSSVDGVLFNKEKTTLICCPAGKSGAYTIPDTVTSIGECAFGPRSSLTSITIPNSVTSIGNSAFSYCESLTSITIPDSVTSIGDYAFYYCTSLTDVYYTGSQEDADKISFGGNNADLTNATWHYKYCNLADHIYTNDCDTICNICEFTREISHIYSGECDHACNICGFVRNVTELHTYDNSCDTNCNVCGFAREVTHIYSGECDAVCDNCNFKRSVTESHTYDTTCDTTCNVCEFTREISHTYSGECDDTCDICGFSRSVAEPHTYDNNLDTICNICEFVRVVPTGIAIKKILNKSVCYLGDNLDTNGLKVVLNYSDGTSEDITNEVILSGFDSSTTGIKTITVRYNNFTATFRIVVTAPSINITSGESIDMVEDNKQTIKVNVSPTNQELIWTSFDTSIATVENGVVKAVSEGTTAIVAEFTYNGVVYSDYCVINVYKRELGDINGDFNINETDYQHIANVYTGKVKVEDKTKICDLNGDGKFDIRDIIAINEIINA